MTKEFSDTGTNGTFYGLVQVDLSFTTEIKEVHNPSTHDEEKKSVSVHRVMWFVNFDKLGGVDFYDENLVFEYVQKAENEVKDRLRRLATEPKHKTIIELLKEKGYVNN